MLCCLVTSMGVCVCVCLLAMWPKFAHVGIWHRNISELFNEQHGKELHGSMAWLKNGTVWFRHATQYVCVCVCVCVCETSGLSSVWLCVCSSVSLLDPSTCKAFHTCHSQTGAEDELINVLRSSFSNRKSGPPSLFKDIVSQAWRPLHPPLWNDVVLN